jgi:hypothetical protein
MTRCVTPWIAYAVDLDDAPRAVDPGAHFINAAARSFNLGSWRRFRSQSSFLGQAAAISKFSSVAYRRQSE